MASIQFGDFRIDIEVQNIDGIFNRFFEKAAFSKGYWVLLTIHNSRSEKESFPVTDEFFRVKTYSSYEEAIEDVSHVLKKQFDKAQ